MDNDWKKRLGVVYSTNQDYEFDYDKDEQSESLPPEKQKLYISLDRKNRKGKAVTLIEGFHGSEDDLKELSRELKSKCGVGGSAKDGEILLQGDHREKVLKYLTDNNYQCKRKGG